MGLLERRVALVTGADSGIGRAIALLFAREGASVVVNYAHNEQKANEVRSMIEQQGGTCFVQQADISQYQQAQGLAQRASEQFGRLDILVNNAGMEIHSPFLDVTEEQFDRVVDTNLKGAFFCAQAAAREMVKQNTRGQIINISSVHEDLPMPENVPYCCAKGGMRMMMRTICLELAKHNITVNNIAPGAIDTPIDADVKSDPNKYKALIDEIPLHRMGQPEEVAHLALYLASGAAEYVTGSTFVIDGGLMRNTGAL
ncbi:SDR family oxidoreductase [Ktedonobacter racemifer]|uniref:Short-chain dehydrogenase/reductase SDR n=1 Tax=Ktedonobacter racemifer DSM 44963 TaxID=485913 RepID=D6TZM7_KTERA|nr:SDR family oxidoreductase [Ktedonobacter racemifer]EFH82017.1 short-chain dehydrogenase/reductase SDR [Ktedonobacter racemifer DSM 44963]